MLHSPRTSRRSYENNMKLPQKKGKIALIVFVNFIVLFALYLTGVAFFPLVTMVVYTVALAAAAFGYVVYNRGFSRKNVTLDMLPNEWPPEKKTEFIEDGKRRLEKSKWVLTVLLPLIGVFAYEFIDVYIVEKWFV